MYPHCIHTPKFSMSMKKMSSAEVAVSDTLSVGCRRESACLLSLPSEPSLSDDNPLREP